MNKFKKTFLSAFLFVAVVFPSHAADRFVTFSQGGRDFALFTKADKAFNIYYYDEDYNLNYSW